MVASEPQAPSVFTGVHLILYDGVCGLCSRFVQFLLRHDRRRMFRFASLQGAVGTAIVAQSGGNPERLASFYVVTDYRATSSRVLARSEAALFVAAELGWPWRAAQWMRLVPRRTRDRAYDVLARYRYRLFGRYDRCLVPSPEFRSRFID